MHELSFGTWLIHISSVIEWIFTIFVIYKISTYKKYNLFFWLSLAMVPNLIGAMCAITWHIYDNQDALYGLVTLQGIFTFIGNSTLALASFTIFRNKETYEWFIHKIYSLNSYIGCPNTLQNELCYLIICSSCDEIEECSDKGITNAIESVMNKNKFNHKNIAIEINGTCNNCLDDRK